MRGQEARVALEVTGVPLHDDIAQDVVELADVDAGLGGVEQHRLVHHPHPARVLVVGLALAPLVDAAEVRPSLGGLVVPEAEREAEPARGPVLELDRLDRAEVEALLEGPFLRVLGERSEECLRRLDRQVDGHLLELVVDLPEVLEEALVELPAVREILARVLADALLGAGELLPQRVYPVVVWHRGERQRLDRQRFGESVGQRVGRGGPDRRRCDHYRAGATRHRERLRAVASGNPDLRACSKRKPISRRRGGPGAAREPVPRRARPLKYPPTVLSDRKPPATEGGGRPSCRTRTLGSRLTLRSARAESESLIREPTDRGNPEPVPSRRPSRLRLLNG